MEQQRRRQFRLRTLMILIFVVGLSLALLMGHRRWRLAEEMARANAEQAWASAVQAQVAAQQALDAATSPSPVPDSGARGQMDVGRGR
jgi:hypothetical protein